MTDERTLDRLIAHLRAQVAELRRREEEGAGADEVADRKRLILRLQEHLSYAVRDLLRAQEDVAARVVTHVHSLHHLGFSYDEDAVEWSALWSAGSEDSDATCAAGGGVGETCSPTFEIASEFLSRSPAFEPPPTMSSDSERTVPDEVSATEPVWL